MKTSSDRTADAPLPYTSHGGLATAHAAGPSVPRVRPHATRRPLVVQSSRVPTQWPRDPFARDSGSWARVPLARAAALHACIPFPSPMCAPPWIDDAGVPAVLDGLDPQSGVVLDEDSTPTGWVLHLWKDGPPVQVNAGSPDGFGGRSHVFAADSTVPSQSTRGSLTGLAGQVAMNEFEEHLGRPVRSRISLVRRR
jgi:hypothetical protein